MISFESNKQKLKIYFLFKKAKKTFKLLSMYRKYRSQPLTTKNSSWDPVPLKKGASQVGYDR